MAKQSKQDVQVGGSLYLFETPYATINGEGQHIGNPCVFVRLQGCDVGCVWCDAMSTWPEKKGKERLGTKYTFQQLTEYLDKECPETKRIWFTGGEPTTYSKDILKFIRYYKRNGNTKRIWHMITAGSKYYAPLLYELDWITIDVKPPTSKAFKGKGTPPEFISWCLEDKNIAPKVEFKMAVAKHTDDINFALQTVRQLANFASVTIQPIYWSEAEVKEEKAKVQFAQRDLNFLERFALPMYDESKNKGWTSYKEFADTFLEACNHPNVRVLIQLHKVYWPGEMSGI